MFTQFSEISARFIQADKSKGVKRLLFSSQYIEHIISTFNEIFNRMTYRKNTSRSLDSMITYNHDTVMQRRVLKEYVFYQSLINICINSITSLYNLIKIGMTFYHN